MNRFETQVNPFDGWTRREFLWRSALAGTAAALAPRLLTEGPPLGVGIIGLGDRGLLLADWCVRTPRLSLAAVCDLRQAAVAAASRLTRGAPPITATDFRRIIDDRRLGALLLALPGTVVEEVALTAVKAGKDLLLAPPVPSSLLTDGRLASKAVVQGQLIALLPRVRYSSPAPWLAAVGAPPRAASLKVVLPHPAGPPTPERLLAEVTEDVDFLRSLIGASNSRLLDAALLAGPRPGRLFELRAGLTLDAEGTPARLDLRVGVAGVMTRRSRAVVTVADRRVHLAGEALRWDTALQPDPELTRFAVSIHERDERHLTLPLTAATGTAQLLAGVADRCDSTFHSHFRR